MVSAIRTGNRRCEEVPFSIEPGDFVVLLGLNGAGKTTLFSLIAGLLNLQQGSIRLLGHDLPGGRNAALAGCGFVFQQSALDLDLTVAQSLRYHAALHGLSGRLAGARSARSSRSSSGSTVLTRTHDLVRILSGGQRRRVEIARALLHRPRLLLLDEATVGLDVPSCRAILQRVRTQCVEQGTTALWATHLLDEVEHGDRTIVLHEGRILDDRRDIAAASLPDYFARLAFIGDSGMTAKALRCFVGIVEREFLRFLRQRSRFFASLVRPLVWLVIFGTGLRSMVDLSGVPPYDTTVAYEAYIVPGLVGLILLFNGMQIALSMVFDREMGSMKVLLVSPLPRENPLTCRLMAGVIVALPQVYAFLACAWLWGVQPPAWGYLTVLPAVVLAGLMLGAVGLLLSSLVRAARELRGRHELRDLPRVLRLDRALSALAARRHQCRAGRGRPAEPLQPRRGAGPLRPLWPARDHSPADHRRGGRRRHGACGLALRQRPHPAGASLPHRERP